MNVVFEPDVFGTDVPFGTNSPTYNETTLKWDLNCPLGGCGMKYYTYNNQITFQVEIPNTLNVGPIQIRREYALELGLKCTYPMRIAVSSDIEVYGVEITGQSYGIGSLANGFDLTLHKDDSYNGISNTFLLGDDLFVQIDWSVSLLPDLTYYVDTCEIFLDNEHVAIIKNGCYSKALDAWYHSAREVQQTAAFSFKTFLMAGAKQVGSEQVVQCTIQLCVDGCDDLVADNADCPDDEGFDFAIE